MNDTEKKEKLVEIKFNKTMWKETKLYIIQTMILGITFLALVFLMASIISMIEQWSMSGAPLVIGVISFTWLVTFATYIFVVNR